MKLAKYLFIAALFLASFGPRINAQILEANVAGSESLWLEAGQGVFSLNHCVWSSNTPGQNFVTDSRVGLNETGWLWVGWVNVGGGPCTSVRAGTQVWAYIRLNSMIGDRCLFAQPQCTLNTTATPATAPAGIVEGGLETTMPASIISTLNGKAITIAGTDILPADAKCSTDSVLALCGPLSSGTQYQGLGYGPGPVGTPILSFYPGSSVNVVDFNIFGSDPITALAIPAYTITPVAASPVIIAVNTLNSNGFGLPAIQNVSREELGLLFGGVIGRTADILPQVFAGTAATYYGTTTLIQDPLGGAYNVFEHSIPNNKELYRSEDIGNCTNGSYGVISNPMHILRTIPPPPIATATV